MTLPAWAGGEVGASITHWRLVAGDPYYERIEHGNEAVLCPRDDPLVQAFGAMPWAAPSLPVHMALDAATTRLTVVDLHGAVHAYSLPGFAPLVQWGPHALRRMLRIPTRDRTAAARDQQQRLVIVAVAPVVVWALALVLQATALQTTAMVLIVMAGYTLRPAKAAGQGVERVVQAQWWDKDSIIVVTCQGRVAVCPVAHEPVNCLGKRPVALDGAAWAAGAQEGRACLLAHTVHRIPLRAAVHAHLVPDHDTDAESAAGALDSPGMDARAGWVGRAAGAVVKFANNEDVGRALSLVTNTHRLVVLSRMTPGDLYQRKVCAALW